MRARLALLLAALPAGLLAFWIMPVWHGDFAHLPVFRHGSLFVRDFSDVVVWYYPAYQPWPAKTSSSSGIHWGMECFATADIDVTPEGDEIESQVGTGSCGKRQPLYGEVAFALWSGAKGFPVLRGSAPAFPGLPPSGCLLRRE